MAYAVPDDVREALTAEGRDPSDATAASLSDEALDDSIAEATAEIDATVKGAPFVQVPRLVAGLTRDIAAYLATLTHRRGVPLPPEHPVALRYARAEMLLGKAGKGLLDLSDDVESAAGGVEVVNPYEGDLFTLQGLGIGQDSRVLPPWNDPWGW